jgi:beta-aspartyl-peptidase (threonine type)
MIRRLRSIGHSGPILLLVCAVLLTGGATLDGQAEGSAAAAGDERTGRVRNVVFAIHGGAGTLRREDFTPELEAQYRDTLRESVRRGFEVIRSGGDGPQAVEAAITFLEDSPLFNAGKGAVFTTDAANELDASIMNGETLDSGAVTGVQHIRNPITLARALMENSRHVMLSGEGAELFASHRGMRLVTQDYFFTQRRWDSLLSAKGGSTDFNFGETGTVGAVGLDMNGDLAAGTSTGGLTNKPVGRIGDSPIIGAGTYADSDNVAVSATGTGELFIRQVAAYRVSAQMEYAHMSVDRAAQGSLDQVAELGGPDSGGLIALDKDGNLAMPFNTDGMYRGWATQDGQIVIKIFADE